MIMLICFFSQHYRPKCDISKVDSNLSRRYTLDFIPRPPSRFADCDDLFSGTPLEHFNMSDRYWSLYDEFQATVRKHQFKKNISATKNTGRRANKRVMAMHYIAARSSVRHICETGFGTGYSAFNFLTSNSEAIVHSFDIGTRAYLRMSKFIAKYFPGRFFIHFGDSRKTVPQFIKKNPTFFCDIIFVDGGHTYFIASADLENCVSISNRSNHDNMIIVDDYPGLWPVNNRIGRAWENLLRRHSVVELMRCMYSDRNFSRGFVLGTTINK